LTANLSVGAGQSQNPIEGQIKETPEGVNGPPVTALAVTGGRPVSGSADGTIRLWNPANGQLETALKGLTDCVYSLAGLPDGRLAMNSGSTIRLWDPFKGQLQAPADFAHELVTVAAVLPDGRLVQTDALSFQGGDDLVTVLAMLPDGRLAYGTLNWVGVFDPVNGDQDRIGRHKKTVTALAVLPDGRLASGSEDKTIKLWNLACERLEGTLEGHADSIQSLAVLLDGRLASGSADRTIKLWNTSNGQLEATLEGHTESVNALAVLPDGRLVFGSGEVVAVWEPSSAAIIQTLTFVADAEINRLAVIAAPKTIIAGDNAGRVHFLLLDES